MEMFFIVLFIIQLLVFALAVAEYFQDELSGIECVSLICFWPMYLIKNLYSAFLLVFVDNN